MLKRLGLLALSLCFIALKSHAVDPSIGVLVPYQLVCEKQSDGTNLIKMQVLLRKTSKRLTLNGVDQTTFRTNPTLTHVLQAKDNCTVLDAMFDQDQMLYGHDAIKVGDDATGQYVPANRTGGLCAYLINLKSCCADIPAEVKDITVLTDEADVHWVTVGKIDTSSQVFDDVLFSSQYQFDVILRNGLFKVPGTITDRNIATVVLQTAVDNLHGTTCCFETFGLNPEVLKGVILQIIDKFNGMDGSFTAAGTFGSCGDASPVTVKGSRTVQKRISICGKDYCLTELDSVKDTGDSITNLSSDAPTGQAARCFTKFIGAYIADGFTSASVYTPAFGTFGINDEICRLIDGRTYVASTISHEQQLHLVCLGDDTYGFAVTDTFTNFVRIRVLGCRFKLAECKKCCK